MASTRKKPKIVSPVIETSDEVPLGYKVDKHLDSTSPSACPVSSLTILGKRFAVKTLGEDEDKEVDGRTYLASQELFYRVKPGVEYNKDSVLHEAIHALELSLDLGMTERQVQLLATGLFALLQDNKEFAKWLTTT